jgi:hypothetical protein
MNVECDEAEEDHAKRCPLGELTVPDERVGLVPASRSQSEGGVKVVKLYGRNTTLRAISKARHAQWRLQLAGD